LLTEGWTLQNLDRKGVGIEALARRRYAGFSSVDIGVRGRFDAARTPARLETGVNGNADYLATFNLRHLREAAALFGIKAVVPGEIWRKIRSGYEEE
jgi:hypothetical protein